MKLLLIADRFDRSALCEASWWTNEVAAFAINQGWAVEAACREPLAVPPERVVLHPHGSAGFESALSDGLAARPDLVYLTTPGPFGRRMTEALGQSRLIVDVLDHWPLCPNDDLMWRPSFQRCELRYPADECGPCAGFERLREMESRLRLLSRAASVVVHARFQAQRFASLLDAPVEHIGMGVDIDRFHPSPQPPIGEAARQLWDTRGIRPRAILLGPPTVTRGVGALLDVMVGVRARVADAEFVVAGDDPGNAGWQNVMSAELREMGLADHVRIVGRVEPHDWPAVLASCDVGIAPSLWDEPCGLFVLQAFASAVPVVASSRGVHAELLQHGSGMLASPRSPALFADRVAMLLLQRDARHAMGEAARLHAVEHHDLGRCLESLGDLIHRLLDETRHAA